MSRHGYNEGCDDPLALGHWRAIVASATRGKRGQKFFRDLVNALDAMPVKRLVSGELQSADGEVCALGCLARARGEKVDALDTYDHDQLGATFDIAPQLSQEVMWHNDEPHAPTPEQRWRIVREWAAGQVRASEASAP